MIESKIKRKILIVEDSEASRILLKEILGCLNVTIIETGCPEEAIGLFNSYHGEIALVLLDLCLPRWDGCKLLKQFRSLDSSVPAIAISALSPTELAEKSIAGGFNGWMAKPIDLDEFLEMVKTFL